MKNAATERQPEARRWTAQDTLELVKSEIGAINTRRDPDRQIESETVSPSTTLDAVGLALSGGGIRSAATCLGVLQAFSNHDCICRVDYLSTVSGGGYIGASLSAALSIDPQFPFGPSSSAGVAVPASEIKDTPQVGHLRNYSNYLIPAGARDLLTAVAIIVRGLVANLSLVLPVLLALAVLTIVSNPKRSSLDVANLFGIPIAESPPLDFLASIGWGKLSFTFVGLVIGIVVGIIFALAKNYRVALYLLGLSALLGVICDFARVLGVHHFALTLAGTLIGVLAFFVWAIARSVVPVDRLSEFRDEVPTMFATYLCFLAGIAFFEFQPFMLRAMFDVNDTGSSLLVSGTFATALKWLAALTAPVAALVTLFRQQITGLIKQEASQTKTGKAKAWIARIALWVGGAALPLVLWIAYLHLSIWGITNDRLRPPLPCQSAAASVPTNAPSVAGSMTFDSAAKKLTAEIQERPTPPAACPDPITETSHSPGWMRELFDAVGEKIGNTPREWLNEHFNDRTRWSVIALYLGFAIVLVIASWPLAPNANSLHRLYRDRLSKAFLFDPRPRDRGVAMDDPSIDQGRDFDPLDTLKISDLYVQPDMRAPDRVMRGPYLLINAALNIQGSDFANRRARNADFFLFSPLWIGSEASGYCRTPALEAQAPGLDLATAMAISGAAASSNMGANSIKALTPTLALLNIRLGYWLLNPGYVDQVRGSAGRYALREIYRATPLYLWSELSGRLYENSKDVYITDGGHIENLGIYELLRRRCKVIIAVDAEADPAMNFPSLITLQRYARIDLGIRIDLPWVCIQKTTKKWMKADEVGDDPPAGGPHVAIGTIDYGSGQTGYLVYIKASLTGDENDYVRDYARRYPDFPHESTGDQFFSEEQFEVYRALGFHMAHGWLSGNDVVTVRVDEHSAERRFDTPGLSAFDAIRTALAMPIIPEPPPEPPHADALNDT